MRKIAPNRWGVASTKAEKVSVAEKVRVGGPHYGGFAVTVIENHQPLGA